MTEKDMRGILVQLLQPLDAFAVENVVHDGTPDVCTVAGWIELKLGSIPKKFGRIQVDLRESQRIWLKRWSRHGGVAWTMTLVRKMWILHDGDWAAEHLGRCDQQEFAAGSIKIWDGRPSQDDLIKTLLESRVKKLKRSAQ